MYIYIYIYMFDPVQQQRLPAAVDAQGGHHVERRLLTREVL